MNDRGMEYMSELKEDDVRIDDSSKINDSIVIHIYMGR